MVDPQALYAVLGLAPGADHAAVRSAYRTLARRLHPDVNRSADAVERMRELNAAYDALRELPLAVAGAASPAGPSPMPRTAPSPAAGATMPFGGFAYRVAGAGTGAVSLGSFASPLFVPVNGITIGIFAGLVGLVTLFAVWAFTVARPLAGSTVSAPQSRVTAPVAAQSTASTLAAQARANAAANAAAARSNLTASTRGEVAGINSTTPVPAVPAAAGSTSAGQTASPAAPPQAALLTAATSAVEAPSAPAVAHAPKTSSAAPPQVVAPVQSQIRTVQPALPAVPATQPSAGAHITTAGQAPAPTDAALVQSATRALSNYDRAWTAYATALRVSTAGTMVAAAASAPGVSAGPGGARMTAMSPTSLLSGEGQLTMARMAHFQQQLAWNTQAGAALTAASATSSSAPRPDPAKTVRADQRLRQAADLVSQSANPGASLNTTQLKSLLDEAEQLHRESVAEWAKLLATLG